MVDLLLLSSSHLLLAVDLVVSMAALVASFAAFSAASLVGCGGLHNLLHTLCKHIHHHLSLLWRLAPFLNDLSLHLFTLTSPWASSIMSSSSSSSWFT